MIHGQWSMFNGQCSMFNVQCSMVHGQWSMVNIIKVRARDVSPKNFNCGTELWASCNLHLVAVSQVSFID